MIERVENGNLLYAEDERRREMVTLDSADNVYLEYPVYGEAYVTEFDLYGYPLLLGFRPYRCNGTLGALVNIGHVRDCEWRTGFHDGAKIMKDRH